MKSVLTVKKIMQGIGTFTLLSLLASFCNFLFNFALIRLLPTNDFRDLALANNMINVFGNLFVALNIVSIALFYVAKDQQAAIIRACQKAIYILYAVLLAGCMLLSGQVERRSGLHDALVLDLTLAVVLCSIPVMILNALYLGAYRFRKSAVLNVCLALGRLLCGVAGALFVAKHKDAAAVGGILVVFVVVFGLFTILEKGAYRKQNLEIFKKIWSAPVHVLKQYRLLVTTSVAYAITINFLLGLDLFMFGQFFSNRDSAAYAAVSVIGKLIFFFMAPVALYLAARQQELLHARPKLALRTTLAVIGLTLVAAATLLSLPGGLIGMLIHRQAGQINHWYLVLSISFNACVALLNYLLIEGIVSQRQRTVLAVAGGLMLCNGALFVGFRVFERLANLTASAGLALGVPIVTMLLACVVLFASVHVLRRRTTD
ncbi:MAG TPA: hypothetical protein VLF91_01945 [Candidatus Saccharimonadales bacterium]|nr:hypothetical protein [Candidatus Saccharimonadales bacterium]